MSGPEKYLLENQLNSSRVAFQCRLEKSQYQDYNHCTTFAEGKNLNFSKTFRFLFISVNDEK